KGGDCEEADQVHGLVGGFEGVGGVSIVESASVRSQVLDDFEGGYRAVGNDLCSAFHGHHVRLRIQVHRHAEEHQGNAANQAEREKNIEDGPREVYPEV